MTVKEQVERCVRDLPSMFKSDQKSQNPIAILFQEDGELTGVMGASNATGAGGADRTERDDLMNMIANAVIAAAKTTPVQAIVIVTETFVTTRRNNQENLAPVDCDRFESDAQYQVDVLKERKECFTAFVETAEAGTTMLTWPIVRKDGTRSLGPGPETVPGVMGRFANLLRKRHALDPIIVTNPLPDFNAKPLEALRELYLEPLYELSLVPVNRVVPPTFDFENMRLTIAQFQGEITLLGINVGPPISSNEFQAKMIDAFNALSGRQNGTADILKKSSFTNGAASLLLRRHGDWKTKTPAEASR